MKRKKTLVAVLIATFVTVGSAFAFGWRHRWHDPDPERVKAFVERKVEHVLDEIDADDKQREQIHALADELLEQAQGVFAQRGETRKVLLEMWKSDQPDAAAVHALIDKRADELRALAHQAADAAIAAHGVLTPEQRAELAKRVEERRGWHRK